MIVSVYTLFLFKIWCTCFYLSCRYRLNVDKIDWNIYVTDVGQWQHFDMLFKVLPNWLINRQFYCWYYNEFKCQTSLLIFLSGLQACRVQGRIY